MPTSEKEYAADCGDRCPVCTSPYLEISPEFDSEGLTEKVKCESCNSTWLNVYSLVGYTNLVEGDK